MSVSGAAPEEDRRVEELLRINAELAAEIRALAGGRIEAPRSGQVPVARRTGMARAALAEAEARLGECEAQLEATRAELELMRRQNEELGEFAADRGRQIAAMRRDPFGIARRIWERLARLLRRNPHSAVP